MSDPMDPQKDLHKAPVMNPPMNRHTLAAGPSSNVSPALRVRGLAKNTTPEVLKINLLANCGEARQSLASSRLRK